MVIITLVPIFKAVLTRGLNQSGTVGAPPGPEADQQLNERPPELGVGDAVDERVGGVAQEEEVAEAEVVGLVEHVHPERQPSDEEHHAAQKQHAGRSPVHLHLAVSHPPYPHGRSRGGQPRVVPLGRPAVELAGGGQAADLFVRGALGSFVAEAEHELLVDLRASPLLLALRKRGVSGLLEGLAGRGGVHLNPERLHDGSALGASPQRRVDDGVQDDDDDEGSDEEEHERRLVGPAQHRTEQGGGEVAEGDVVVEVVREDAVHVLHLVLRDGREHRHGRDGHHDGDAHHGEHALVDVVHGQPVADQTHRHVPLHSYGNQRQVGSGDGQVTQELENPADDVGSDEMQLQDDGVGHDDGADDQVDDG